MKHWKVELRRPVKLFATAWVSAESAEEARAKGVGAEVAWDWEPCDASEVVATHVEEDEDGEEDS